MPLTIKDALRLAQADPNFANELTTNPTSLKATFNLTNDHIAQLTALGAAASRPAGVSARGHHDLRRLLPL